jgi:hypothetical protein
LAHAGAAFLARWKKERWPARPFSNLSQALVWAERVAKQGTVVVAIDTDDGTQLSRADLASRLGRSLA